jgi:hypothetical protein
MEEYRDYMADYYVALELPKGITTGATKEDIIAAFGEPTNYSERVWDSGDSSTRKDGDVIESIDYYNEATDYSAYRRGVEIRLLNNALITISVNNMSQLPSDFISEAVEVTAEITEMERNYRAPAELGDDFASFNVEIDGDLYTLPAPVSAFVANGWEIADNSRDMLPERTSTSISLVKDNKRLSSVTAANYSENLMYIENCFVTNVTSRQYSSSYDKVVFTIPGGITGGMSEEDFLAIAGDSFERHEYSNTEDSWYYKFAAGNSQYRNYIEVVINKEDGSETATVGTIEMDNRQ